SIFEMASNNTGKKKIDRFLTAHTILHEIIHAIAKGIYTDDAYALAGEKMGLLMSVDEFVEKYPEIAGRDPNFAAKDLAIYHLSSRLFDIHCQPRKGYYTGAAGVIKNTFP
ncbi:MAG TPA: hypothetical protein PKE69_19110, partial [Pyrinomonadaceae bacterium]|nr:hypothetical protein [Pyrinomonadaceae bacterium]